MTDFGLRDPFAGVVKGVILGINPSAGIVDLCHEIAPGDIRSASFALMSACPYFPDGSIFVIVVDPGVGSERRAIAAQIDGGLFVCPDNGILSWVLRKYPLSKAVELKNERYFLPEISHTFHGRDVFAPAAAHLSMGVPMEEMGPDARELTTFAITEPQIKGQCIQGEVVYIDRFGNLITNIERGFADKLETSSAVTVHIGSTEVPGIRSTYEDVPRGHAVAIFGSSGFLEIAVNGGSASQSLGVSVGAQVSIYG